MSSVLFFLFSTSFMVCGTYAGVNEEWGLEEEEFVLEFDFSEEEWTEEDDFWTDEVAYFEEDLIDNESVFEGDTAYFEEDMIDNEIISEGEEAYFEEADTSVISASPRKQSLNEAPRGEKRPRVTHRNAEEKKKEESQATAEDSDRIRKFPPAKQEKEVQKPSELKEEKSKKSEKAVSIKEEYRKRREERMRAAKAQPPAKQNKADKEPKK